MALYGALTGRPRLAAAGIALAVHDRADYRVWLRIERVED